MRRCKCCGQKVQRRKGPRVQDAERLAVYPIRSHVERRAHELHNMSQAMESLHIALFEYVNHNGRKSGAGVKMRIKWAKRHLRLSRIHREQGERFATRGNFWPTIP